MFGFVRKQAVRNCSMKRFFKYYCCDHVR